MRLKFLACLLCLCLFDTFLGAEPLSAQSRKPSPSYSPKVAERTPNFSAGAFEEIEGKICLRVKLNDTLETRMLVDSGAWTSLLSPKTIKSLHLALHPVTLADTKLEQGTLAKVAVGKATLTDVKISRDYTTLIASWNNAHPKAPIGGVLGLDILERHALGLDFYTHTYGLWVGGNIKLQDGENFNSLVCAPQSDTIYTIPPGESARAGALSLRNPPMRQTTPQKIPLEKAGEYSLYHTSVLLNDVPVTIYLDTGAGDMTLTDSIASKIKAAPLFSVSGIFPDEARPVPANMGYVRKFKVGSFETILNLAVVLHREPEDPEENLLGTNAMLFPACRIILDFPGHTLFLSHYDVEGQIGREFCAKLYDQGLFFDPDKTQKHASLIIGKDSPAEKAGILNGDELLEVNGKTPKVIREALAQGKTLPVKMPLQVAIRRPGKFEKQIFTLGAAEAVALYFTGDPPPFPEEYLKPPTSAGAVYLDPVQDRALIERAQQLLQRELAKYPPAFLTKNLKEIYVFKDLTQDKVSVGGFGWADHKRLYIQNDARPGPIAEVYFGLTLHHELAHILIANYAARFSRSRWEKLNAPTFHYGVGGLESIRAGGSGSTQLDPRSWEVGFARPYGMSDFDEDFACICEGLFCGDPRFWQAVDRVEILNKKVKMAIEFYHALDETMTETYFRNLPPLPSLVASAH